MNRARGWRNNRSPKAFFVTARQSHFWNDTVHWCELIYFAIILIPHFRYLAKLREHARPITQTTKCWQTQNLYWQLAVNIQTKRNTSQHPISASFWKMPPYKSIGDTIRRCIAFQKMPTSSWILSTFIIKTKDYLYSVEKLNFLY